MQFFIFLVLCLFGLQAHAGLLGDLESIVGTITPLKAILGGVTGLAATETVLRAKKTNTPKSLFYTAEHVFTLLAHLAKSLGEIFDRIGIQRTK